jgi:tetratricopeptide (TPR) repeat protein
LKDEGNNKFKAGAIKEAENHYRDASSHLDKIKELTNDVIKLKLGVYQNLALMLNKQNMFKEAVGVATAAIQLDDTSDKAYYHRHSAYKGMKQWDEAIKDLKEVIKIHPQEKKYRVELDKLKAVRTKLN